MNAKLKLNLDRLTGTFDVDPSSSRIYSRDAVIDLVVHGFERDEVVPVNANDVTPPGKPVVQFVNSAGRVVAQAMLAQPTGDGAGGAGADGRYDLVAILSTNTVEMRREFFGAGPQAVREFTVRILDTETANPIACGPFPVWNFPGVCGDAPTELPSASGVLAELRQIIKEHTGRTDNPHAVTAALISALTQTEGDARYAFKASVTTLSGQVARAVQQSAAAVAAMRQHMSRSDNPHGITATQVGLGNVDNTCDLDKPVSHPQRRALDEKQNSLSNAQLAAVNSGIDASKVAKIAQNESAISAEVSRATAKEAKLQVLINAIKTFEVVVADSLPSPSEQYNKKLYLIPSTNPETRNVKDEFICVKVDDVWGWEQVGSTAITIEFDAEPTEGSQNAARSGGIWAWVRRLLTGKLDKNGGTLTGGLTFEGEQFGIKFNDNRQSISFSNGIGISQYGILINGKPVYYPSESGTLALTSDIPAAVAVIDHADATTTGKAADALKVKEALDEKRGITDRKNYPETVQVLAERLPVMDNGQTFSNIRVVTDGPFRHEVSKYKVCGDVPEYQDIVICELDSFGKYVDGNGSSTFGGVAPTAGMQIACGGETGVSDGDTLALTSDIDALAVKAVPRYPFVDAAIVDGKVTIAPYTNEKLTSDGTAFTVAVGGESIYMRDCVLRVECGDPAPKITWPSNYYPRTDAETDFACVAGKRNVYWISEYAPNEFCVAGWQETDGGNAA